jgi:hypothetical protein
MHKSTKSPRKSSDSAQSRPLTGQLTAILLLCIVAAIPAAAQTQSSPPQNCHSEQLVTSTPNGPDGGLGNFAYLYQVANASTKACILYGVPRLRFVNERGKRLNVTICSNCDDYIFPAKASETITLRPGESAHFLIGLRIADASDHGCERVSHFEVLPQSGTKPLAFNFGLSVCGRIDVSAWRAGVYKNEELQP